MKIFFFILILAFNLQSWTKADNIGDFEIEEMSVGESLLNYMDENSIIEKINSKSASYYPNNSFVVITYKSEKFKIYDDLGIVINPNDKSYIIHSIEGTLYMNDCRDKQLEVVNELKVFFDRKTYEFLSSPNLNYIDDKTGESKVHYEDFYFKDNSAVRVICWSLSKKILDDGYKNSLAIAANSKYFMNWINENM